MSKTKTRKRKSTSSLLLGGYGALIFAFLYIPIVTIVLFSFGDSVYPTLPFNGFTLDWYRSAFTDADLLESLRNSLLVAPAVGLVSATIGLLAARELSKYQFRGKGVILLIVLGPLLVPLIVFGLGLLLLFSALNLEPSIWGAVIAHSVFGISLSTLILYSRLLGFRESLMESAVDLGATPVRAFFEVMVPLVFPAFAAAFLLSFTLSFDEFLVAWFVIGFDTTLPVEIWGRLRYGITPEINAIATGVLLVSLTLGVVGQRLARRGTDS
jgi:ABC-type spermidine/putrescine transport system permease subunit II